ncbi:14020_t:CDS:2 [Gigaspora margarita]|uniref:14020_t:CDS:1 n=1 Tax=Gigaspora margarita TaxID=4874 RepID=A0ABN7VKE1_GIGMA|nr:14020_t:CDS:2 [Gigaspora margarita]
MEQFYEHQLLGLANSHPDTEYLVPSQNLNNLILNYVPQDIDKTQKTKEPNNNNKTLKTEEYADLTIDPTFFKLFLETIKHDYENCGLNLQIALEKFAKQYNTAKDKSIPALKSFLYNINYNVNPLAHENVVQILECKLNCKVLKDW